MNLVGGYESSDDEGDEHNLEKKASKADQLLPDVTNSETLNTSTTSLGARAGKKPKAKPGSKATKVSKKKKSTKIVNALILSPEIQAALARGYTLGDSDSDDTLDKKPPKIVRPAGSNANNLLSLLPKPSTAGNAESILLNSKRRRREVAEQRGEATTSGSRRENGSGENDDAKASPTASRLSQPAADRSEVPEREDDSNSNGSDGEELLDDMRAASASRRDGEFHATPLFTLPSRSKPPQSALSSTGFASSGELTNASSGELTNDRAGVDEVLSSQAYLSTSSISRGDESMRLGSSGLIAGESSSLQGGFWGLADQGQASGVQQGEHGLGPHNLGAESAAPATGREHEIAAYGTVHQWRQEAAYDTGANQAMPMVPGLAGVSGGQEVRVDADLKPLEGKASKRKGRDMERALARGDLGALGKETPVMDLRQGDNEYNPLRTKPTTAAMKPEQKHIEASVYDPHTGTTKKTLEPTSLQKRKHQINQLAAQAAGMERELMERSGASRLTKAQTRSKYGW